MGTISDIAIAGYAKAAGFSGSGLVTAIAIALAESGGDPNARGYNKTNSGVVTSVDRGLWQINSVYHAEVSDSCAFSPSCAAGAAFRISNRGTNWTPWSTYGSGAYRQFLSRATTAANGGGGTNPPTPAPTPPAQTQTLSWQALTAGTQSYVSTMSEPQVIELGDKSKQGGFWGPFQQLVAAMFFFGILYVIARTKAGYVAIYYGEVLILLFLFATQAQYFREGLLPFLSKSHGEIPAVSPEQTPLSQTSTTL